MKDKFFYIKETETDGTLYSDDGGVAIIWHNGEHLVGQVYKERISPKCFYEKGIGAAFEEMVNDSSNSSMFDFENEDEIVPSQIQELSEWIVCSPRRGDFFENLTMFVFEDYDKNIVDEELNKALTVFFDNKYFKKLAEEDALTIFFDDESFRNMVEE